MKSTARLRVVVLLVLTVVALVSSLLGVLTTGDWGGFALNLGTEMVGAVVTYLLLELVIGRMEKREAEREAEKKELEAKKAALIAQMGSSVKKDARRAVEELERHGWLCDGSLQGAKLDGANLQGTSLLDANLEGAKLLNADLRWADLSRANLKGADLRANLQGVNLFEANLSGAHLDPEWAPRDATLPDGTKWTANTDMTRFTDPNHPDFWQPDAE